MHVSWELGHHGVTSSVKAAVDSWMMGGGNNGINGNLLHLVGVRWAHNPHHLVENWVWKPAPGKSNSHEEDQNKAVELSSELRGAGCRWVLSDAKDNGRPF